MAYSTTASSTIEETTSISAESRSTTSVMPNGPMPGTLWAQPPTWTASVPSRSVR